MHRNVFGGRSDSMRMIDPQCALGFGAVAPQVDVTVAGGRLLAALGSSDEAKVVVVDDAQWADTPSLHAIRFAIRRLDVDRVAVLACSRPTGEAFDVLLRAVTSFDGTHIRLGGLSVQDLMDLGVATDHALTAPSARRLHEHTGGLPLHVVALLEELDPAALQRVSGPLPAP